MLNFEIKDAVPSVAYAGRCMETMGNRIRLLREARRFSQEELGKRVGVSKSAVSQWEDGSTKNIKLQTFLRLVDELKTDVEFLIFGASREAPPSPGSGAPSRTRAASRNNR